MPYTLTKAGSPVLQTLRTYEARRDALASISNTSSTAGGTTRSSYTYSVNSIGQRTDLTTAFSLGGSHASNPGATDWAYDTLGQLETADAEGDDIDRAFSYDSIGNRRTSAVGTFALEEDVLTFTPGTNLLTEYFGVVNSGTPSQPGANVLNQYAGIKKAGTTREPIHDTDGNATAYPLPAHDSLSTLAWDAENRLTSVTVNSVDTTYLYDALSRRIAKTVGGTTTLFIYDGWNCIAEYTGTTLSEIRTWGLDLSGSMQGAGGVGGLLAEKQGGTFYYPTYDGNGNVSEYLATNGDTAAHFEYDPFGNTVVNTDGTGQFNYRFSTKPLDFETGLYYYGYRFYDPVTGRWPSRDPIEERGGVNLYGFASNQLIGSVEYLGLIEVVSTYYECQAKVGWRERLPKSPSLWTLHEVEGAGRHIEIDQAIKSAVEDAANTALLEAAVPLFPDFFVAWDDVKSIKCQWCCVGDTPFPGKKCSDTSESEVFDSAQRVLREPEFSDKMKKDFEELNPDTKLLKKALDTVDPAKGSTVEVPFPFPTVKPPVLDNPFK